VKRRHFLGGAAAGLTLPLLPALVRRAEGHLTRPQRIVFWWVPEGVVKDDWWPGADGSSRIFGESNLIAHRARFATIRGIDFRSLGSEDNHLAGPLDILSGGRADPREEAGYSLEEGQTIDTLLGPALQGDAPFETYAVGVQSLLNYSTITWERRYRGRRPVNDPLQAFNDLVGPGADTGEEAADRAERLLRQRRSVLDSVRAEIAGLRCELGSAERVRLDQHLDSVRSLEERLGRELERDRTAPPMPELVVTEEHGRSSFYENHRNLEAVADLQVRIAAAGVIAGSAPVMSFQFAQAFCRQTYPFLSDPEKWHHDLSHNGPNDELRRIGVWHDSLLADFLELLDVPDPLGEGTVLDNTLVIRFSELADGRHSKEDLPFLLAGRPDLVRHGEDIDAGGISHNDMLTGLLEAFDHPVRRVGLLPYNDRPYGGWRV